MEIHVLASGSKGNATYIKTNSRHILIDVGLSYSKIKNKLSERNIDIRLIDTVILTHEHRDHICGLSAILKNNDIKDLFLSKGTSDGLNKILYNRNFNIIKADTPFNIDELIIEPLMTFHDANEPLGFLINDGFKRIAYITDTGYIDKSYIDLLTDLDLYILESNHSPFMLINSGRPFVLIKRILSESGHLSNEDAVWFINSVVKSKKTIWIVAHISEECNSIFEIERELVKGLSNPDLIDVYFATQEGLKGFIL